MKFNIVGFATLALAVSQVLAADQCSCDPSDTTCLSKCGKF